MNQPAQANLPEYSVSEISGAVKRVVEDSFGYVRVRGEISGYRGRHSSGHAYFTLKDERARIEAVIWKTTFQRLRHGPEDGLEVIATGKLTTFPGSSKYQIVIDALEPAGAGAIMALIEERRRKLAAEGLFDEARKKPLPYLPRIIGVVTSPTGAVIQDILHRLRDRCPARVIVWPVRVQGEGSAAEVTAAIEGFNRMTGPSRPDVLIVARGGGSLEDLLGFSEESVVRAAAGSLIPLVSAIGHETDFTLIDFAADRRAPTPTAAAEMAVPVRAELLATVATLDARQGAAVARRIDRDRKELRAAARALPQPESLFAIPRRSFDELASRLGRGLISNARVHRVQFERAAARLSVASIGQMVGRCRERTTTLAERAFLAIGRQLERKQARLSNVARALPLVSYHEILGRGFAVVRAGGVPVRSVAALPPGTKMEIELHDGTVGATVDGAAPARKKAPSGSQGSLF